MKPKLIASLVGVSRQLVYKVQAKLVARDKYECKRESREYREQKSHLESKVKRAIETIGLPHLTTGKLH